MEYEIVILDEFNGDLDIALNYISYVLKSDTASKNLSLKVKNAIKPLSKSPELYAKVTNLDGNETIYRRITIGNYVLLYTIDYNEKIVYISAFYYRKKQLFKISLKNSKAFRLKNHNLKIKYLNPLII